MPKNTKNIIGYINSPKGLHSIDNEKKLHQVEFSYYIKNKNSKIVKTKKRFLKNL